MRDDEEKAESDGEPGALESGVPYDQPDRASVQLRAGKPGAPRVRLFEPRKHRPQLGTNFLDLMYEKGIAGMRYSISNTAEYGDITRGKRIIGAESRQAMRDILEEIQSGEFAREWIAEVRAGQENFDRMRSEQAGHQVEVEGRKLRAMMAWIDDAEFGEG